MCCCGTEGLLAAAGQTALGRSDSLHFFDRHQREERETPTGGIVLCSEKNDAMVRITLPEDDEQIHTASYQLYLPTEDQLREHLVAERERLEQARRVGASEPAEEEPTDR
jgi:hypothetical protein